jgi:hypothetical protein
VSWLKRARRKEGARDLLRRIVLLAIKVNMFKKIIFEAVLLIPWSLRMQIGNFLKKLLIFY